MILIFGFGRSGTSWVSDIISRYLGQLILFEPCHPGVFNRAREYSYKEIDITDSGHLFNHLQSCLNKELRNRWLLRNYLSDPLEKSADEFIEQIWENCEIAGFKSIRLNQSLLALANHFNARVIYIIRHPYAVTASTIKRANFWNEFGFEMHWQAFNDRLKEGSLILPEESSEINNLRTHCNSYCEKLSYMWGVSQVQVMRQLRKLRTEAIFYEDIYLNPFKAVEDILLNLGYPKPIRLHPSYLFTPSMTTHRTIHELRSGKDLLSTDFPEFFWTEVLSEEQLRESRKTIISIAEIFPAELNLILDRYRL